MGREAKMLISTCLLVLLASAANGSNNNNVNTNANEELSTFKTCYSGFVDLPGRYYPRGHNIDYSDETSVAECRRRCLADETCYGFTHRNEECWLKDDSVGEPADGQGWFSARKCLLGSAWARGSSFTGSGAFLNSANGRFRAELSSDGNLCVIGSLPGDRSETRCRGGLPRGASSGRNTIVLSENGNLCRKDGNGEEYACEFGQPQPHDSMMVMQNDGNLVIYQHGDGCWRATWAIRGAGEFRKRGVAPECSPTTPQRPVSDERSVWERQRSFTGAGTFLQSSDGRWRAELRADGDLCVVGRGSSRCWGSAQSTSSGDYTITLQEDGNLCRSDRRGHRYSCEFSQRQEYDSRLVMQNDGNLVIYQIGDGCRRATWSIRNGKEFKEHGRLPNC